MSKNKVMILFLRYTKTKASRSCSTAAKTNEEHSNQLKVIKYKLELNEIRAETQTQTSQLLTASCVVSCLHSKSTSCFLCAHFCFSFQPPTPQKNEHMCEERIKSGIIWCNISFKCQHVRLTSLQGCQLSCLQRQILSLTYRLRLLRCCQTANLLT